MSFAKFLKEITAHIPSDRYTPLVIYPQEKPTAEEKVNYLFRQMLREKKRNNKNMMTFYAFKLGQLLEEEIDSLTTRSICLRKLTPYYRVAVSRTFYIFEHGRETLIPSLKWITLGRISRLTEAEYVKILQVAEESSFENIFSTELEN